MQVVEGLAENKGGSIPHVARSESGFEIVRKQSKSDCSFDVGKNVFLTFSCVTGLRTASRPRS